MTNDRIIYKLVKCTTLASLLSYEKFLRSNSRYERSKEICLYIKLDLIIVLENMAFLYIFSQLC